MNNLSLKATSRDLVGKKVKNIRLHQQLPAVIYGHGLKSTPVTVDAKEFRRVWKEAGTSTLVDLALDEAKPVKVLIQEPQLHYLKDQPIHADFYAVKMDEELETEIPVHFIGQSPAVEEQEGNLITNKTELTVRCLPKDLPSEIEVDISTLQTFEDQIRIKDLSIPAGVEVMHDPEDVVALVEAPRSEEELEAELAEEGKEAEEAAMEELDKAEEEAAEGESVPEENK